MEWNDIKAALGGRTKAVEAAEAWIAAAKGMGDNDVVAAFMALPEDAALTVQALLEHDMGRMIAPPDKSGAAIDALARIGELVGVPLMRATDYSDTEGTLVDGGTKPWFGGYPSIHRERPAAETALILILREREPTRSELVSLGFYTEATEKDYGDSFADILEANADVSEPEVGLARIPFTVEQVHELLDTIEF